MLPITLAMFLQVLLLLENQQVSSVFCSNLPMVSSESPKTDMIRIVLYSLLDRYRNTSKRAIEGFYASPLLIYVKTSPTSKLVLLKYHFGPYTLGLIERTLVSLARSNF